MSGRDLLKDVLSVDLSSPLYRVFTHYLEWKDRGKLDIAVCGDAEFREMLDIAFETHVFPHYKNYTVQIGSEMRWRLKRKIKFEGLRVLFAPGLPLEKCMNRESMERCMEKYLEGLIGDDDYGLCRELRVIESSVFTESSVATLIPRAPNTTSLNFSGCISINDVAVACISASCAGLKMICLDMCKSITDISLRNLSLKCHELRSLSCTGCKNITAEGVINLAKGCRKLEHLNMGGLTCVTDESMATITHICRQIRALNIAGCPMVTSVALRSLSSLEDLQILNMKALGCVTDEAMATLMLGSHNMRELDIGGCFNITDTTLSSISCCERLCILNIEFCKEITDVGIISLISGCKELRDLNIRGCFNITDTSIISLSQNCTRLERLNLSMCKRITDLSIARIAIGCKKLHFLDLSCCEKISDVTIRNLSKCHSLKELNLERCMLISNAEVSKLMSRVKGIVIGERRKLRGLPV